MSDCHREEENLSVFVDGELPAGQQRSLARHLLECPECAAHAGRLLAVKYYLGAHEGEPAPLGAGFWGRLDQALDVVDAVALHTATRPATPRASRRAWTLAGAGACLILVAWVLRLATLPLPVPPEALGRQHEELVLQAAPGPVSLTSWAPAPGQGQVATPLSPARFGAPLDLQEQVLPGRDQVAFAEPPTPGARSTGPPARAGRTWLPQARLDQALGAVGITQRLYSVPSLPVSVFRLPPPGLARQHLSAVRLDSGVYYLSAGNPTSLVAWRQGDDWRVLAADTSLSELLSLAEVFSRTDTP